MQSKAERASKSDNVLRQQIEKWCELGDNVEKVAKSLYRASKGDTRRLTGGYKSESSPFGAAATDLFATNSKLHRFLLHNLWNENKHSIKEKYANHCVAEGKRKPKNASDKKSDESGNGDIYCWCERKPTQDDPPSVQCDFCQKWYHCLCSGLTKDEADVLPTFKCLICNGSPAVPSLLRKSYRRGTPIQKTKVPEHELNDPEFNNSFEPCKTKRKLFGQKSAFDESSENLSASQPPESNEPNTVRYSDSKKQGEYGPKCKHQGSEKQEGQDEKQQSSTDSDFEGHNPDDPRRVKIKTSSHENEAEFLKTDDVPTSFNMSLTREEWNKVVTVEVIKTGVSLHHVHRINDSYAVTLSKYFNNFNKVCVLSFNKKNILQPEDLVDSYASYVRCYGKCIGNVCTARYGFYVTIPPDAALEKICVEVRKTFGSVRHLTKEILKRPLKGDERKMAKIKLAKELPSVYRKEIFSTADIDQIRMGNYDVVKSLKVFQQVRAESLKDQDYHPDVIIDLWVTYLAQKKEIKGTKLDGYIQLLSLQPFYAVLFSQDQLDLLRHIVSRDSLVVLFVDATGTLPASLPVPLDNRQMLYFAAVLKSPREGDAAVPVAEFYSAGSSAGDIQACLQYFFDTFHNLYPSRRKFYGISRVEIDFSKAMLAAFVRLFNGCDVEEYLSRLLKSMANIYVDPYFPIHISRIHINRFLDRRFHKCYNGRPRIVDFWTKWKHFFLAGKDLWSFYRRVVDAFVITGNYYLTNAVAALIQNIENPTIREGDEPWANIHVDEIPWHPNFWRRSPFGFFANEIAEEINKSNGKTRDQVASGKKKLALNEYYSPQLFDYLKVHFFPYAPILNKAIFQIFDLPIVDDTTNPAEYYIKTLKHDKFKNARLVKIPRLIRQQTDFVIGSARQGLSALRSLPPPDEPETEPVDSELDNSDTSEGEEIIQTSKTAEKEEGTAKSSTNVKKKVRPPKSSSKNSKSSKSNQQYSSQEDLKSGDTSYKSSCSSRPSVSSERQQETFKKPFPKGQSVYPEQVLQDMPILPWGGELFVGSKKYSLSNTCNFDCSIQLLFYSYAYLNRPRRFISIHLMDGTAFSTTVELLLKEMGNRNFSECKRLWVQDILLLPLQENMDLKEEEREYGLRPLQNWMTCFQEKSRCLSEECPHNTNPRLRKKSCLQIRCVNQGSFQQVVNRGVHKQGFCKCGGDMYFTYTFSSEPPDLLIYSCDGLVRYVYPDGTWAIKEIPGLESELQREQVIRGTTYEIFAYTMYTGAHYYIVIWRDHQKLTCDGLHEKSLLIRKQPSTTAGVSAVWLQKKT